MTSINDFLHLLDGGDGGNGGGAPATTTTVIKLDGTIASVPIVTNTTAVPVENRIIALNYQILPEGFGSYLQGILPDDIATAAGAFSATMQQIKNIRKVDFEKFALTGIDDDHFKMIEKRVYDIAACNTNLKVYFNGKLINIKAFEDYIKYYTKDYFYEAKKDKTWSLAIGLSENGFQQVSFANSTDTYDGGTHVDYVMNQIIAQLRDFFMKKHKVDIRPGELKNHMFLFLDSTIINPSFSSQTKEKLITEIKDFGSTFEVSNKLVQSIIKSEIVNSILDWIQQKKSAEESKLQRDLNKKLDKIKVEIKESKC